MASHVLLLAILALSFSYSLASDPSPLQDFCVADLNSNAFVNGFVCKNPKLVTADDFTAHGLDKPGNTSNPQGSAVTPVFVEQLAGLNTLGVSLARLDFAPYGLIVPHYHPRGTEIMTVLEGELYVGFVTSAPDFKLFAKIVKKGDVFVFPKGLVHFQFNYGAKKAVAISGLGSQDPGVVLVPNAVFGSNPPINDGILAKAFQLDKKIIDYLQSKF
ncbi:Germin protein [Dioscorea alata]|uniref:Germin protein n=1 Tax=Dioscorea alata TaxID=55571 RepID=A0ACB7U2F6_DIOAL|nr:Germin protein [Dioscorea alata]